VRALRGRSLVGLGTRELGVRIRVVPTVGQFQLEFGF